MIRLDHISKSFQDISLFHGFSYTFEEQGLYVLFGPSGCGKTTMLNIIAGICQPDEGTVYDNDGAVETSTIANDRIAYLTQDTYFVDYLTIRENLELCNQDQDSIERVTKDLGISHVLSHHPTQISGGERQRAGIARALLQNKTILLLDEPTSAIDRKNRDHIYAILQKLKSKYLFICVSHDESILSYADHVIDFHNLDSMEMKQFKHIPSSIEHVSYPQQVKLYSYVKKQGTYYKINRKVSIVLCLFFTLILLVFSFFTNTEDKIMHSLATEGNVNQLSIHCSMEEQSLCLQESKEVKEIVYAYDEHANAQLPDKEIKPGDSASVSISYLDSLKSGTLPMDPSLFLKGTLSYDGTYIKNQYDIMLGIQKAQDYADQYACTVDELIGKIIEIQTIKGKEKFHINGIFDSFANVNDLTLKAVSMDAYSMDQKIFFSNEYAKSYLSDRSNMEGISLHYYFDSFDKLQQFETMYNENEMIKIEPVLQQFSYIIDNYKAMEQIFYPIAMGLLSIIILFYVFLRTVQLRYASHILSVYQYCGYTMKQIRNATLWYYVLNISKLCVISTVMSWLISALCNKLNENLHFFTYTPCMLTWQPVCLLYLSVLCFTILCFLYQFHKLKHMEWYDLLKKRRDLL